MLSYFANFGEGRSYSAATILAETRCELFPLLRERDFDWWVIDLFKSPPVFLRLLTRFGTFNDLRRLETLLFDIEFLRLGCIVALATPENVSGSSSSFTFAEVLLFGSTFKNL